MFWPADDQSYHGFVASKEDAGNLKIIHDDGETECLYMTQETGKFTSPVAANSSMFSTEQNVKSTEGDVLLTMTDTFGNKSFLKHQEQGFEQLH